MRGTTNAEVMTTDTANAIAGKNHTETIDLTGYTADVQINIQGILGKIQNAKAVFLSWHDTRQSNYELTDVFANPSIVSNGNLMSGGTTPQEAIGNNGSYVYAIFINVHTNYIVVSAKAAPGGSSAWANYGSLMALDKMTLLY